MSDLLNKLRKNSTIKISYKIQDKGNKNEGF